ncbi:MAG TPA: hypothetical protein VLL08_28705 [Kineosporiaceae bacterium]|nr:hypothetical protein [Kineosporiaceae bacterium]
MDQPRRSAAPTGWQSPPDQTAAIPVRPGRVDMDAAWSGVPVEAADDDLDLLAEVNHRPSRATVLLIVGIIASLAFLGGSVVQKNYGGTSTGGQAAGGAGAAGFGARAGGYGNFGGGFPGGQAGGAAGVAAGGAGGAATGGGAASGTTTAAATPVAVGTVTKVSGSSLTLKNLGGKTVKVTIPEGASITLVAGKKLTTLKAGVTVSVAGKVAADGSVTATSVTVRS